MSEGEMRQLKGREAELKQELEQVRVDWLIQDLERIKRIYDQVIFLVPKVKPRKEAEHGK